VKCKLSTEESTTSQTH